MDTLKQLSERIEALRSQLAAIDAVALGSQRSLESLRVSIGAFRRNIRADIAALKKRIEDLEVGGDR